jgi:hypothetical protein
MLCAQRSGWPRDQRPVHHRSPDRQEHRSWQRRPRRMQPGVYLLAVAAEHQLICA